VPSSITFSAAGGSNVLQGPPAQIPSRRAGAGTVYFTSTDTLVIDNRDAGAIPNNNTGATPISDHFISVIRILNAVSKQHREITYDQKKKNNIL
jgi:hypothetical protein